MSPLVTKAVTRQVQIWTATPYGLELVTVQALTPPSKNIPFSSPSLSGQNGAQRTICEI